MFQFTHPGRGATTDLFIPDALDYEFQFTHPGRGATSVKDSIAVLWIVSIHAPREGCDSACNSVEALIVSFNSRTPGGVRRARYDATKE